MRVLGNFNGGLHENRRECVENKRAEEGEISNKIENSSNKRAGGLFLSVSFSFFGCLVMGKK